MNWHRMRRLSLVVAGVVAVAALAATTAQAEVGSHWNVNGSAISSTLLPAVEIQAENNHLVLLAHILGVHVEILCTAAQLEAAVFKSEGSSLGKLRFTGCVFKIGGTIAPACEPHTGSEKGVILTKLLKDLIVLVAGGVAGEAYDRLEPEEGSTWVVLEGSEECSIGEKVPIIGKLVLKDCNLEMRVEKVTHLVEEGPSTEMWVISKTAEHKATVIGSANMFLVGPHEGLKWSGTPA